MQVCRIVIVVLVTVLICAPVYAGHESVPVGSSGLVLHDTAVPQDKHYLDDDRALLDRIYTLMCDMDVLLAELHALPAELSGNSLVPEPTHYELLELIEAGLNHNPGLAPYRSQQAVLAARTRQAGSMQDPMASFKLLNFPAPQFPFDDTAMTQISLGVSQKFESYGKRKLKRKIASIEEQLTEMSLGQRELELVGQVTDLYFDTVDTQSQLRVLDDNRALLSLLVEFAERKLALGLVSQAEVIDAQIKLTMLDEQELRLTRLLEKQLVVMQGLLGNPEHIDLNSFTFAASYPLPVSVVLDTDQLLADALELRPDYQRLELMSTQQDYMVELAHRGFRPDYTITASYGIRWGKRDFVSAGVSFPLFTNKKDKQDAKLQESWAMLSVTEDLKAEIDNSLSTRILSIEIELGRLVDTCDLYRNALLPQTRLALDSGIASFAADRLDLSELIRMQQSIQNHEIELEHLYIEYLRSLSELQVLTAGVFDPSPYLEPDPGAHAPAELNMIVVPSGGPGWVPPIQFKRHGSFLERLDLPDFESADSINPEVPVENVEDPAGEDDPSETEDSPPSEKQDFFAPFSPAGNEDGND